METVNYKKENVKKEKGTIYEIPLQQAIAYTKAWAEGRTAANENATGHFIKAFLIDAQELSDILNNSYNGKKPSYIRVYLGLDESQEEYRKEKLIAVPVNEYGFDIIGQENTAAKAEPNSNVFDFTLPCPPTCDSGSVLYFGPADK